MKDNIMGTKARWVSDSILVFISPLLAYLILYMYEFGYTRYFGIPIEFISIDFSKFIWILGGSWVVIISLFLLTNLIIIVFHGVDNYIIREIKSLIPMAVILIMRFVLYGRNNWNVMVPALFVVIFIVVLVFLFPLLTQRSKPTYKEKLEAQAITEKEITDIFSIIRKKIGRRGVLLILALIIILDFSYSSGNAYAMNKQEFIHILNKPNTIVLCKYGDYFVCGKIDRIEKCIIKEFSLINIQAEPTNIYRIEKLLDYTIEE